MSKSGKDSESAEARRKREASLESPRVVVLDDSQTVSPSASLEEDQPAPQDEAPPAINRRPAPYKISFDNVDANRVKALKDENIQKIKYQKQKVSVGICIFLGLFFFIGLPIYLVGLFVYNKISEWKFNKAQATELSQAEAGLREHEVEQRALPHEGTEAPESSRNYSIYSDSNLVRRAPSNAEEANGATEAAQPAQAAQAAQTAAESEDDTQEDSAEDSQEDSHSASHSDTPLVKK